jgi:hypothetical protein
MGTINKCIPNKGEVRDQRVTSGDSAWAWNDLTLEQKHES